MPDAPGGMVRAPPSAEHARAPRGHTAELPTNDVSRRKQDAEANAPPVSEQEPCEEHQIELCTKLAALTVTAKQKTAPPATDPAAA